MSAQVAALPFLSLRELHTDVLVGFLDRENTGATEFKIYDVGGSVSPRTTVYIISFVEFDNRSLAKSSEQYIS